MSCDLCKSGKHKFKCFICEHPGSLEEYRNGHVERIHGLIVVIKLCVAHAQELDEIQQKREIEMSAA